MKVNELESFEKVKRHWNRMRTSIISLATFCIFSRKINVWFPQSPRAHTNTYTHKPFRFGIYKSATKNWLSRFKLFGERKMCIVEKFAHFLSMPSSHNLILIILRENWFCNNCNMSGFRIIERFRMT